MLVTIGGDKGSPGATTVATLLALCWPSTERVLAELDLRGADLPYRLHHASGGPIRERPSIAGLAVNARPGAVAPLPDHYAQPTTLGVPLIPGELTSRSNTNLARHVPTIAAAAACWQGTVIADIGCLAPGNAALAAAKAATAALLVTRATVEGLGRLADRVDALGEIAGDASRQTVPVGVIVVAPPADASAAVRRIRKLLAAVGSPATPLGAMVFDGRAATQLWSQTPTQKLLKTSLVRSAQELVAAIRDTWPEVLPQHCPSEVAPDMVAEPSPMLAWPSPAGEGSR